MSEKCLAAPPRGPAVATGSIWRGRKARKRLLCRGAAEGGRKRWLFAVRGPRRAVMCGARQDFLAAMVTEEKHKRAT